MKNTGIFAKRWLAAIALSALFMLTSTLLAGCGGGYRSITVTAVTGGATVERQGQKTAFGVYEGMKLQDGDTLTVSEAGNAVLKLDDDKFVYLEPGTRIEIAAAGGRGRTKTTIRLIQGSVTNMIRETLAEEEGYSVTVENVALVVRGTIFRITLGTDENGRRYVLVQTVEGEVSAEAGSETLDMVSANTHDVIYLTDTGGTVGAVVDR